MKAIIIIYFIFSVSLNAQTVHNIWTQLLTSKTDIEKEKTYRNLCEIYSFTNME